MTACDECWGRAFTISRTTGKSQVEAYHELIAANPEHCPDEIPFVTHDYEMRGRDDGIRP